MKKIIVLILSLALALSLSVCAFAAPTSFDPTLDIDTSEEGVIGVKMNDLPDGVSAELTIPCDGWNYATVKDEDGNVVPSTFANGTVTFEAEGGVYIITKSSAPSYPGYYNPIVSPEEKPVEKPTETKPVAKPVTPPAQETVTPVPEDTTPVVPDEPVTDEPVVDDTPAVDTEPTNSAGLWIGVGIVALAAIVVVLAVMVVRKKRK